MAKQSIRICPKCKSTDINEDISGIGTMQTLVEQFTCNNCGYSGPFFPEVEMSAVNPKNKGKTI